ncbi:hypothetical protein [Leptospira stimsonii]|uniref:hypothetical protein n=1 Tax=Leptospira stimsonii TaxID=2202203 RepID=UPI0019D698C6|nr:hypothetical protein [Leptospira stimsonii]
MYTEFVPIDNVNNSFIILKIVSSKYSNTQLEFQTIVTLEENKADFYTKKINIYPIPYPAQMKAKKYDNFMDGKDYRAISNCNNIFPFPVGQHYFQLKIYPNQSKSKMNQIFGMGFYTNLKKDESYLLEYNSENQALDQKTIQTPKNIRSSLCGL